MLSEQSLYEKYPWAKPVVPDIKPEEGFYDLAPWSFSQSQLKLIDRMFGEMESWFTEKNQPVNIAIFEVRELFGSLEVEFLSSAPEIRLIVERYRQFFEDLEE